jgi:hypothetical protein
MDIDLNKELDGGDDGTATATLPPVTPAPQAPPVADEPLPSDYKSLMELHQQLYHAIPREKSKAARAKLTERHAIVKSRLAAMQNGPPPPVITADHAAVQKRAHLDRPANRAATLEKLRAAKAAFEADPEYFSKISLTPLRHVSPVVSYMLTPMCPGVLLAVANLREAIVRYQVELLQNWGPLHPDHRLNEIRAELANCSDPQRNKDLQDEVAILSLPTAALTARNLRVLFQQKWEAVEFAHWRLLAACQIDLESAQADCIESEKLFFESHPLKLAHERTSASQVWESTLRQIEQLLQQPAIAPLPELSGSAPKTGDSTALYSLLGLGVLNE